MLKENEKSMSLSLSEDNDSINLQAITSAHEKLEKFLNCTFKDPYIIVINIKYKFKF